MGFFSGVGGGCSMVEMVPDSLQGLEVCGKLRAAILLLLQLPPECTQLLLSLHLDVIGHHHCCLEVCLKPAPLLFFILQTQTYRSVQYTVPVDPHINMYMIICKISNHHLTKEMI